mmetsp:Transcript_62719/g.173850  ORF Transcript_62719/g.173850 Transcript_62719/m.173850 type:complete len:316 (+) Transcript_62719:76-1023(+)
MPAAQPPVPPLSLPDFVDDKDDVFATIVDLSRYPIDRLDSPACQALIADCSRAWAEKGLVSLPGFIKEDMLGPMTTEVSNLQANRRLYAESAYAKGDDGISAAWPADHPSNRLLQTDIHAVAGDLLPPSLMIRKLYDSRQVARFFARVLALERVYQYGCPWQCLNVHYMKDAGQRSWHYDGSDFVVTVKLQNADDGGEFEYAPFIRGELQQDGTFDERFDKIKALFDGSYTGPRFISRSEPGTLNIFNGRRTLHRVRAVYGPTNRILAILSYDTCPREQQTLPDVENNVRKYGNRVRSVHVVGEAEVPQPKWLKQ